MANFRVIILGAGPVGLFTANALAAAGIDYIVLERQPEIVRYRGALIVIWPPFVRLLDQLGLLESVMKYSTRFTSKTNFTHAGEPLSSSRIFDFVEECLGYPTLGLSRGNLIRALHDNLSARETKIRANAHAVNIESLEDGVRVHLEDGGVVDGSIVIAADGVHSSARKLIQRLGHASSASGDLKPTSPMIPNYLSVFGQTRSDRADIALGNFAESHGPGIASQSARMSDAIYFTVLKRLEVPPTERKRFTTEDLEKMVEELPDITLFPGVKLNEIWRIREQTNAVLLYQEEGIAEKWHHGRIVLAGDAAHKMTSINGQGALTGVLSATTLVNLLQATLVKKPRPTTSDLEAVFAEYEASRRGVANSVVQIGITLTALITWTGENAEAIDRKTNVTEDPKEIVMTRLMPIFTISPVLDFIPFEGKQGTVPWKVKGKSPIRARL